MRKLTTHELINLKKQIDAVIKQREHPIPIEELDITVACLHFLRDNKITILEDICNLTHENLAEMVGYKKRFLEELKDTLESKGLSLAK
jgi:DNA-directed RNA polymerase alpha subunit